MVCYRFCRHAVAMMKKTELILKKRQLHRAKAVKLGKEMKKRQLKGPKNHKNHSAEPRRR